MDAASAETLGITEEFVRTLGTRAADAERRRQLPKETVEEAERAGLFDLLVPRQFGGTEAPLTALLDPVRRMAHGCTSSAWTLAFYTLHSWMVALFSEEAQREAFRKRPFLAPAPLAPTGRAVPKDDGYILDGRWSWATGVMNANWALVSPVAVVADQPMPMLALLPIEDIRIEDVWHTDGMCATGSNDVIVENVFVPAHRTVRTSDVHSGESPGAALRASDTYRWPMVPALALVAAMPALGTAERITQLYAERLCERVLAFQGTKQKDKPAAQIRLSDANVRLLALRGLLADTTSTIDRILAAGDPIGIDTRAQARLAAAHIVHESRSVIADVFEASGASVHFLNSPMQRGKRDVDVLAGHVIFDYDASREVAGAVAAGVDLPASAMV